MSVQLKAAFAIYIANILVMLTIGFAFVFRNEFMPFHSDVIGMKWNELNSQFQILYLGMMRTEGAGFLASATALIILSIAAFRKPEQWLFLAMSAIGIVEYFPTFIANYHVSQVTNATPPWLLMLSLILSLTIASLLAFSSFKSIRKT